MRTPASTSTSSTAAPTTSTYSSSYTSSTSYAQTSSSTIAPVVAPVPATTEASSSSLTASETPSPVTSVRVVTISGAIVTQTVTSTPMVVASSNPDSAQLQRKRLSGGAIAGIVIGSLLGVAALLFGAFLLWRRRKQNRDAEDADVDAGAGHRPNSPRRTTSVLSKTGLLSRGRPASVTEKDLDDPLYVNTHTGNNSVRHSMMFAAGGAGEGVSPVSPLGSSHENDSERRHSRPLVYDQRLNPSALFMNADGNGSRVSMQDQQDYSRPLGIMNPDPRPSFESRISRA
ncbi:hypothetical protein LTR85_005004 [Meristemomyces frigidus]|nr:hypothetical protein LTR85_005004 [Meristemomyces frigidus]